jgi:serine phosphatase RsbU (regulator of sigma subunit)
MERHGDPRRDDSPLAAALAASDAAVALLRGPDLVVEYANAAHLAMFGWSPGWSLRKHAKRTDQVEANRLLGLAERVKATAKPAHAGEVHAVDGRIVQVRCSPVDAGTAAAGVLMVAVDATDQVEARRRAEDNSERLTVLDQATAALTTDMDPRRELIALAESVVPSLADACAVYLVDQHSRDATVEPGQLHATRLVCVIDPALGVTPPRPEIRVPLADTRPMSRAVATREVVSAHGDELRAQIWGEGWLHALSPHSLVAVPLGGDQVLAVVDFLACGDRPPYQPSDLSLMREISARADVAVGNAMRLQLATEVALALQRGLLSDPAEVDWLDVAVRYRPAVPDLEVGGDWYDVLALPLPAGGLALTVGDVVGHDLYAVSTMGQLRSMVQALACQPGTEPASVLSALNDLSLHLGIGHYATLVHGRLTRTGKRSGATLTWSNAGHPPPLMVTPDGTTTVLDQPGSPLLGLAPLAYSQASVHVPPGAQLLFYTDGLIEDPLAPSSDPIGALTALVSRLADLGPEDLCDRLIAGAPIADDIALLVVRVRP